MPLFEGGDYFDGGEQDEGEQGRAEYEEGAAVLGRDVELDVDQDQHLDPRAPEEQPQLEPAQPQQALLLPLGCGGLEQPEQQVDYQHLQQYRASLKGNWRQVVDEVRGREVGASVAAIAQRLSVIREVRLVIFEKVLD